MDDGCAVPQAARAAADEPDLGAPTPTTEGLELPATPPDPESAGRALRETEARLTSLFHFHPHGVFSLDVEGRFTSVNEAAQVQSGGYSEAELLRMNFVDLLDPADVAEISTHFLALLAKEPRNMHLRFRRKDGVIGELEIIGLPIVVDGEVTGIYGIAEDVTERRRVERMMEEARSAAQEASEAKSRFLATVSHEIRTPLTSVLAALELLGETDLDRAQARLLDIMGRSGERLLGLVNDILDFARIEAGRADLVESPFRLRDVLVDVELLHRATAEAKGLTLVTQIDDELDVEVSGDALRLAHVLTNLVSNAVKFTESGGVAVEMSLATGASAAADPRTLAVRIAVTDSGIGMTREQQRSIFESFRQADSSITRTYGGTGLGLSIARELVALMGGTIAVASEPDRGSTFTVLVPLRLGAD